MDIIDLTVHELRDKLAKKEYKDERKEYVKGVLIASGVILLISLIVLLVQLSQCCSFFTSSISLHSFLSNLKVQSDNRYRPDARLHITPSLACPLFLL